MSTADSLLSLVPHLEERVLGRVLKTVDVALDARAASISIVTEQASLAIRLYTAGGAEPDPYVEIKLTCEAGTFNWDEGGFAALTPALAGMKQALGSEAWSAYDPLPESTRLGAGALGAIVAMSVDSSEVAILFPAHAISVAVGMSSWTEPGTPRVAWFKLR